jgi:hypothetical protein
MKLIYVDRILVYALYRPTGGACALTPYEPQLQIEVRLAGSASCILYTDGRMFVGLMYGSVAVFSRDDSKLNMYSSVDRDRQRLSKTIYQGQ